METKNTSIKIETTMDTVIDAETVVDVANSCKLFVGNIPFNITDIEFSTAFGDYDDFADAVIVRNKFNKKGRGFGFLTFSSQTSVDELLEKDDFEMGGRTLRFTQYNGENKSQTQSRNTQRQNTVIDKTSVFVNNIDLAIMDDDLTSVFERYGAIRRAIVLKDRETGNSRGFGIVEFAEESSCSSLLDSSENIEVNGKILDLSPYRQRVRNSNNQPSRQRGTNDIRTSYNSGFKAGLEQGYKDCAKELASK
jgi:RNA recognition motif-containing protein